MHHLRIVKLFFLFLSIFLAGILHAQEPVSIHLTEKDGLPDVEFYDILEDKKGFIWLAADRGLYRYDGRNFVNYTNNEKRGLSVFELNEDDQGRIWCMNISGQVFYTEGEELKMFMDLQFQLKGVLPDLEVTEDHILIFSRDRAFKIVRDTKDVSEIFTPFQPKHISGGPVKIGENYLFTSDAKLYAFTPKAELKLLSDFNALYDEESLKKLQLQDVPQIHIHQEDTLISHRGLNSFSVFKLKNGSVKVTPIKGLDKLQNTSVLTVKQLEGQLVFGTNKGVLFYDYDGAFHFDRSYLNKEAVSDILIDGDKNYWFTSLRNGVFVIPNIYVNTFALDKNALNINAIDKLDDEQLVYGTVNGRIGIYDFKENTFRTKNLLSDSNVSAVKKSNNRAVIYVSQDIVSQILDVESFQLTESQGFTNAKDIAIYDDDAILFTSYFGAALLENAHLKTDVFDRKILLDNRGYTCYRSGHTGVFYVSYVDDLIAYNQNFEPTVIRYNDQQIFAISITEDEGGTIWVSTFKNGIYKIENNTVVYNYTTKDGLLSNQITEVFADGTNLWMVSDEAIQVMNTVTSDLRNFTRKDGIPSFNIKDIEKIGSKIIFASNVGLFGIHQTKAFKTHKAPKVYISTIKIQDKDRQLQESYNLAYNENKLSFTFNTNTFQAEENIIYEYRLDENKDWSTLSKGDNTITLNSLSPGKYIFQVRPKNLGYIEVPLSKRVYLKIRPPYWKTWWFVGLIFVFLTTTIALIIYKKWQSSELKRRKELENVQLQNDMVSLELENLRSQMNPHFIFNALNSIQEYIILNKKDQASDYLGKFSDLIRGYLDNSVEETITIAKELEGLEIYLELEKMRFEEDFTYHLDFDQASRQRQYEIPTMLLQPYIENAFKHGLLHKRGQKRLDIIGRLITTDSKAKVLEVAIKDNGVGRGYVSTLSRKQKQHKPFATKATSKRIELMRNRTGSSIRVEIKDLMHKDGTPSGTKVVVTIPVI